MAGVFYSLRIAGIAPLGWRSGKLAAVVKYISICVYIPIYIHHPSYKHNHPPSHPPTADGK
eukprot:2030172-Prorocentrum_lima.AAC.1